MCYILVGVFLYERLFLFSVILLNVSFRSYLTGVRPGSSFDRPYRMSLINCGQCCCDEAHLEFLEQLQNTGPLLKVLIFGGSFSSAVDKRTSNNL